MTYRFLFALLFLAGCNAPIMTPNVAHTTLFHTTAEANVPAMALPYTILAEGTASAAPSPTVEQFRSQDGLTNAWQTLPFYKTVKSLSPGKLQHLDFGKESVYLVGIPYANLT